MNLELGGVTVPGPVVFAYMLAFGSKEPVPQGALLQLPNIPKLPIKRDIWKANIIRQQLPVVCARCMVVQGHMEGGRLNYGCWRCNAAIDRVWWDRLAMVNTLVGQDWGTDALACLVLKHLIDIRSF